MQRKRISLVLSIVTIAACYVTSVRGSESPARNPSPEQEVRALLNQLREAQLRNDVGTLEQIYAEDYTLTEDDGIVFTKKQRIAAIGKLHFASSTLEDVRVRIYNGDAAIVNYKATVRFGDFKPETAFTGQVTSVFVKKEDRWQLVASHESSLNPNR